MNQLHPPAPASIEAKARYKKEIAEEMGYSLRTFQRRLDEAKIEVPRGLIRPDKQQEIYRKLGWRERA